MIRPIQKSDLERIEEIWYQESVRIHNWMVDPQAFWDMKRDIFKQDTYERASFKFVFEEDSIIKGFITGKEYHIWELFVGHQYQGKGIATFLYKLLIRLAKERGLQGFTASVLASNNAMMKVLGKGGLPMKAHLEYGYTN